MANSTADGSVVIDVDMNVSQAEKRLGKLRGDIKKTEKEVADRNHVENERAFHKLHDPTAQTVHRLFCGSGAGRRKSEATRNQRPSCRHPRHV